MAEHRAPDPSDDPAAQSPRRASGGWKELLASPRSLIGRVVVVAGAGTTGLSVARYLVGNGAQVIVADDRAAAAGSGGWAVPVEVVAGLTEPPPGTDLIVTSPGWRPDSPLFVAAADRGVPVIGDIELAWWADSTGARSGAADDQAVSVAAGLDRSRLISGAAVDRPTRPWLAVTGTNGKTTTIGMVESILLAAGRRAVASGNVGLGVLDVVTAEPPHDVIAVELSSFQLHYAPSVRPAAGAVLNVAEDHLDWHGSMAAYAAAKARVLTGQVAVAVIDDAPAAALLARSTAEVVVGVTAGDPGPGQLGVRAGWLFDDAFAAGQLLEASEVRPPGAHNVTNALVAAALCLSIGLTGADVAAGLRTFVPGGHRNTPVAEAAGVRFIDDSKATNPHAAYASLCDYPQVVWVAGGQLKGVSVDQLVESVAPRLRGAVVIGVDRESFAAALRRHAPEVPVLVVADTDDGVMTRVVTAAAAMATTGDVVLLAPAAASLDMFSSYAARGDAFTDAARALPGARPLSVEPSPVDGDDG